jgi:hypothetical protein
MGGIKLKIRKLIETTAMGIIALVAIASLAACSSESTSPPLVAASQAEVPVPTATVVVPTSTPAPEPTPDIPAGAPTKGEWAVTTVSGSYSVDKEINQTKFYTISFDYTVTGDMNGTGEMVETGAEHGGLEGSLVAQGFIHFTGTIGDSEPGTIVIRYNRSQNSGFSNRNARFTGDREYLTLTSTGGLANLHGTEQCMGSPSGEGAQGSYEGSYYFD